MSDTTSPAPAMPAPPTLARATWTVAVRTVLWWALTFLPLLAVGIDPITAAHAAAFPAAIMAVTGSFCVALGSLTLATIGLMVTAIGALAKACE